MTRYLLDVNVLIALIDAEHIMHDRAHDWFATTGAKAWATCPLTENGVVRIVANARYLNSLKTPAAVLELLAELRALPGHEFWPDDVSLFDRQRIRAERLMDPGQVTDSYLLAVAVAHGGQLATFDARLVTDAVVGGQQALHRIV